jgi:hypothetical protein
VRRQILFVPLPWRTVVAYQKQRSNGQNRIQELRFRYPHPGLVVTWSPPIPLQSPAQQSVTFHSTNVSILNKSFFISSIIIVFILQVLYLHHSGFHPKSFSYNRPFLSSIISFKVYDIDPYFIEDFITEKQIHLL